MMLWDCNSWNSEWNFFSFHNIWDKLSFYSSRDLYASFWFYVSMPCFLCYASECYQVNMPCTTLNTIRFRSLLWDRKFNLTDICTVLSAHNISRINWHFLMRVTHTELMSTSLSTISVLAIDKLEAKLACLLVHKQFYESITLPSLHYHTIWIKFHFLLGYQCLHRSKTLETLVH